jgi:hypothetical protein
MNNRDLESVRRGGKSLSKRKRETREIVTIAFTVHQIVLSLGVCDSLHEYYTVSVRMISLELWCFCCPSFPGILLFSSTPRPCLAFYERKPGISGALLSLKQLWSIRMVAHVMSHISYRIVPRHRSPPKLQIFQSGAAPIHPPERQQSPPK